MDMVKLKITENCVVAVEGQPSRIVETGEEIEVSREESLALIGSGRAVPVNTEKQAARRGGGRGQQQQGGGE